MKNSTKSVVIRIRSDIYEWLKTIDPSVNVALCNIKNNYKTLAEISNDIKEIKEFIEKATGY